MSHRFKSIGIYGSSSGRNAGDAALLSGIMDGIDKVCGRRILYDIPTYRPDFIFNNYENRVRPASMLPWHGSVGMFGLPTLKSILRTDLSIIYDNMLFDRDLFNPLTNYMPAVRYLFPLAKRRGHIIGMYDVGTGPVTTSRGEKMLREIGEMVDFITVRDNDSLELLRKIGVQNPNALVTADAAFNVSPSSPERVDEIMLALGLQNEREILALNVNAYLNTWAEGSQQSLSKEQFVAIYASAIDSVIRELKVPVMFVATQHHDFEVTQSVISALKEPGKKVILSNKTYSHYDIRGVLERVSLLFAMRLHANILCMAGTTPAIALGFQKKVKSIYSMLGLAENVMSFDNFSEAALVNHILTGWQKREDTRAKLERVVPIVREESLKGAEVVALIDQGYSPAEAIKMMGAKGQQKVAHG